MNNEIAHAHVNNIKFQEFDGNIKKAVIAGLLGVSAWAIREYFPSLINTLKESLHRTIVIDADKSSELFEKLEIWLSSQKRVYCSSYVARSIAKNNEVSISIGYTPTIYNIKGKMCLIERSANETNSESWQKNEKISIKILYTKDMEFVNEIMTEISAINVKNVDDNRVKITCGYVDFYKNKRDLCTVAMNPVDKKLIVDDITKFLSNSEYYAKRGIVYKRNYMVHGEPGCGKSSLIWALASHFNMNLRLVDISEVSSASDLQRILAYSTNTLVVFEDIDAMKADVKKRSSEPYEICEEVHAINASESPQYDNSTISMSSLLNVFDGINTPDGSICIFTTNHINKLDKAFLREGRMDVTVKMGKIGKEEIINSIAKNMMSADEVEVLKNNLSENIEIIPSKCQSALMDNSLADAVKKLNENVTEEV